MTTVLVTGANGFIGRALCARVVRDGLICRGAVREIRTPSDLPAGVEAAAVGEIGPETNWASVLSGVDVVVHLAARAHVMRESAADPLAEYRRVNAGGARTLAHQAGESGVRRFVLLSSVGVHGDRTEGRPFQEDDPPRPERPYALSKWEAEQAVRELGERTGMETVVLRPPLVYGPGVKGNMRRLLEYVDRGWPLPFGALRNRRSLMGLENLVDALMLCITRPEAIGRTFLVSDGQDISTADLIRAIAGALGKRSPLLPLPDRVFRWTAALPAPLRHRLDQVAGSLTVDSGRFRAAMGWTPPATVEDGIRSMAKAYLQEKRSHG